MNAESKGKIVKKKAAKKSDAWFVYILQCAGGRLYTGMTNDVARRFLCHRAGSGGHFTRAFKPTKIAYVEPCASRSDALKREARIKRLDRKEKLLLTQKFYNSPQKEYNKKQLKS
ncbi:MAG: GIY-YIG nuclease family protein [Elusimicrobia bacterium]|nr:GIY-YIG nuclease family protein [Elusimicrobiota bacterium]